MNKAIITYSRPSILSWEDDEIVTTTVEHEDSLTFYAKVTGAVAGIVGAPNRFGNVITEIVFEEGI